MAASKEAYANVQGGRLKLKGAALAVKDAGIKKKKKKKKAPAEAQLDKITKEEETPVVMFPDAGLVDTRTAFEKRHDEKKKEQEERSRKQRATKSHRERMEEFNARLTTLSEHYDIPNVSGGG